MRIAPDRLNPQVLVIERAQSEIRIAVKDAVFKGISRATLDKSVRTIILKAISLITIPDLKKNTYISLVNYYNTQRRTAELLRSSGRLLLFLALAKLVEKQQHVGRDASSPYTRNISLTEARDIVAKSFYIDDDEKDEILNYGNALNIYHKEYIQKHVEPYLKKLAEEEALDPESENYFRKRSTLRNKAEREVRHQWQINQIEGFKSDGVRLVICSSHANCSERCREWQGRVYSLDGSTGVTDDGRKYVPLETATQVLDKSGKWYNGLLGFNCRHYLVKYESGRDFPRVSEEEANKKYEIDRRQRELERNVRIWRTKAAMNYGVYPDKYKRYDEKAKEWYKIYRDYSERNNRSYYPSRVEVL